RPAPSLVDGASPPLCSSGATGHRLPRRHPGRPPPAPSHLGAGQRAAAPHSRRRLPAQLPSRPHPDRPGAAVRPTHAHPLPEWTGRAGGPPRHRRIRPAGGLGRRSRRSRRPALPAQRRPHAVPVRRLGGGGLARGALRARALPLPRPAGRWPHADATLAGGTRGGRAPAGGRHHLGARLACWPRRRAAPAGEPGGHPPPPHPRRARGSRPRRDAGSRRGCLDAPGQRREHPGPPGLHPAPRSGRSAMSRAPAALDRRIALGLWLATFLVLWATERAVGFVRDESVYFAAAEQFSRWWALLFHRPATALSDQVITQAFDFNHEHPMLMKSLFGWSHALFRQTLGWVRPAAGFRLPAFAVAALIPALLHLWGTALWSRRPRLFPALPFFFLPRP